MLELTENQRLFYSALKKENWYVDERRSGKTVFSSYMLYKWFSEPNNRILYVGFQPHTIKNLLQYSYNLSALTTSTNSIKYRNPNSSSNLDICSYTYALTYLTSTYTHILVDEVSVLDKLSKNDFKFLIKDNIFVGTGTMQDPTGNAYQRVIEILNNPTIQLEVNLLINYFGIPYNY